MCQVLATEVRNREGASGSELDRARVRTREYNYNLNVFSKAKISKHDNYFAYSPRVWPLRWSLNSIELK